MSLTCSRLDLLGNDLSITCNLKFEPYNEGNQGHFEGTHWFSSVDRVTGHQQKLVVSDHLYHIRKTVYAYVNSLIEDNDIQKKRKLLMFSRVYETYDGTFTVI